MLIISFVVALGVILHARLGGSGYVSERDGEVLEVSDGWYVLSEDGSMTEFTDFGRITGLKEIVLSRIFIFPQDRSMDTLRFLVNYCAVEVWQDDVLKFSLWSDDDVESGRFLGIKEVCVGLDDVPGEASEIVVRLHTSSSVTVSSFYLGSAHAVTEDSFTGAMPTIGFVVAAFVLAASSLIIVFFGRKRYRIPRSYKYFTLFVISCAFWMLSFVKTLSVFNSDPVASTIAMYEWVMFLPVPFCLFLYHSFRRLRNVDIVVAAFDVLLNLVLNILHVTGIADFSKTGSVPLIMVGVCLVLALVQAVADFIRNKSMNSVAMLAGLFFLTAGSFVQLSEYYEIRSNSYSVYFITGLLVFIFLQIFSIIRDMFKLMDEGMKAGVYLSMAKTDPLTGLGNRRALDLYISDIAGSRQSPFRLGCMVCDLNDLKTTNDIYGHAVGDKLIKDFAHCLEGCFENRGIPFRTGGDEFYILFGDVEVDMAAMMQRLGTALEESNSYSDSRISCSSGCHAASVPAHDENAIWDVIKRADAEMYKQKRKDRELRARKKEGPQE